MTLDRYTFKISKNKDMSNAYTLPTPAYEGLEVKSYMWNASAERTAYGLKVQPLGRVYEVKYTLPLQSTDTNIQSIYSAIKPFIIYIQFFNVLLGKDMILKVYPSDIELSYVWRNLQKMSAISFIGVETLGE